MGTRGCSFPMGGRGAKKIRCKTEAGVEGLFWRISYRSCFCFENSKCVGLIYSGWKLQRSTFEVFSWCKSASLWFWWLDTDSRLVKIWPRQQEKPNSCGALEAIWGHNGVLWWESISTPRMLRGERPCGMLFFVGFVILFHSKEKESC